MKNRVDVKWEDLVEKIKRDGDLSRVLDALDDIEGVALETPERKRLRSPYLDASTIVDDGQWN